MTGQVNGRSMWVAASAVGGLILAIVGAVGGAIGAGYMRDQQRIETEIAKLNARLLSDAKIQGEQAERLNRVDSQVAGLDVSLQREMRVLDDAMKVMIVDLDHRVQAEITRSAMERHAQLDEMRSVQRRHEDLSEQRFLRLEQRGGP